ncbi:MAG: hypothetical protein JWQ01_2555 [Massilia sp.]|nr:hypothetical protein [Massilia sp.]
MKIFMSWSGRRSHAAAEVVAWWLKCVIQASRPWISSEDVDRGALWFNEITNVLADTSVGIVCLTDENKDRPWILFEAGALAKGLSNSRVCTFLVDLESKDIKDPLAQFNHTGPTRDDMKKLARTLNSVLGPNALDTNVLSDVCDTYWPIFEVKYKAAMDANQPAGPVVARADDDVLGEILESVRGMNQRVRSLENNSVPLSWTGSSFPGMDATMASVRKWIATSLSEGFTVEDLISDIETNPSLKANMRKRLTSMVIEMHNSQASEAKGYPDILRPPRFAGGGGLLDIPPKSA